MRNRVALRLFLIQLVVIGGGVACFLLLIPASVLIPHIADKLWWTCILTVVGMILLAVLVSTAVASYVAYVIEQVKHVTRAMMAGDLDDRISVSWSGVSGELGLAVNTMAEVLTERVRQERREQSQLKTIIASMQEAVVVVDNDGFIILSNPASQTLLGMSASPVGLPIAAACRSVELAQLIEKALTSTEGMRAELKLPPIAPLIVSAQATPWRVDNNVQGVVVVGYDLTPQRQLEEVQREFVANVSHELKTPLTAIRGYAETLQNEDATEPVMTRNFVNIIARNAEQMQFMVEDLLRLSKLEAGRTQLVMEEVAVADVVSEVIARFHPHIQEKKIDCQVKPLGVDIIRTDYRMLTHIINNLVDNAVKYSREGDTLRISGRQQGDDWTLEIADTGVGISSEELPRVFERFWRADRSRTRATGGSGLGLAIVRQMVSQLRGSITVASQEGKGTIFTICLPMGM
ncbi:MAG: hypothetical protein COV45_06540 [Deltaproteobacteria bacterium CG11_big_fil_rev_8_21_14_0_20_47_16]|nr:MAG: hypothetical protein COV45_06540 [Deltaproteobacteria bacterium CG11_big_fil_rev_8_21_14_0_20_47_16]